MNNSHGVRYLCMTFVEESARRWRMFFLDCLCHPARRVHSAAIGLGGVLSLLIGLCYEISEPSGRG